MSKEVVRTRFAPSPTGFQHVGGIRTALFSYLFAKNKSGKFIIRIEDTDQKRFVDGAEKYVIDSLHWAGIQVDEGPGIGGNFGPYRQSERLNIYKEYVNQLLQNNKAYYAFDTPEEIEVMKSELVEKGNVAPMYGHSTRMSMKNSLTMSPNDVDQLLSDSKVNYVVRLKVEHDEEISFFDEVKGLITINSNEIDDKVILKSDGYPTYHLANVVDDKLMEISHVFRGDEWIPSTPFHILLYRAFGWEENIPQFAHLPLILKPSGQGKLSKRDGDRFGFPVYAIGWENIATHERALGFKEFGYLPEGFINFLAFLGWNPGIEEEVMSLPRIIEVFSIDRIHKSGTRFDIEKAKWFNEEHIKRKKISDLLPLVKNALEDSNIPYTATDNYLTAVIELLQNRISFLPEFAEKGRFFFIDPVYDKLSDKSQFNKTNLVDYLKVIREELSGISTWQTDILQEVVKGKAKSMNLKMDESFQSLRFALTGELKGIDLFQTIMILEKEKVLSRLDKFLLQITHITWHKGEGTG